MFIFEAHYLSDGLHYEVGEEFGVAAFDQDPEECMSTQGRRGDL